MRQNFKRVIALLLMLATIAGAAIGGAFVVANVVVGYPTIYTVIGGFAGAILAASIINVLGFRLKTPFPALPFLDKRASQLLSSILMSGLALVSVIFFMLLGSPGLFDAMGIITGSLLIFIWGVVADWLGFRVQYRQQNSDIRKKKRISRVDELFANLSDAEIRELRHRLISEAEGSNVISEDEWYEEKSKRRLQAER